MIINFLCQRSILSSAIGKKLLFFINLILRLSFGKWPSILQIGPRLRSAHLMPNISGLSSPLQIQSSPFIVSKTMTKIFEPILHSALMYIAYILLFTNSEQAHQELLARFLHITNAHGIMLSEKKSQLAQTQIDFLGMYFSQGEYNFGPHITQ